LAPTSSTTREPTFSYADINPNAKFSHLSKNCPLKNQSCTKCKRFGHSETDCNLAIMISSCNNDDYDDYVEEETETEDNEESLHNSQVSENFAKQKGEDTNLTLSEIISEFQASQIPPPKANETVFKTNSNPNPPLPKYIPDKTGPQHLKSDSSTPINQKQSKRKSKLESTANYLKQSDITLSSNSNSSPSPNSTSKKPNINSSNNE